MDREGEYCAALLCVGGPPATRPRRNLTSSIVKFSGMTDSTRSTYSAWAVKVRVLAVKEGWITGPRELFAWITGFLKWFDNLEERYHA